MIRIAREISVVGAQKGGLIVHAGGQRILVDQLPVDDASKPAPPVEALLVADDGRRALIRCVGPKGQGFKEQRVELFRPGRLTIRREVARDLELVVRGRCASARTTPCAGPNGTVLTVTRGRIARVDPRGYAEKKVHYGGMEFADPHPFIYPVVTASPEQGVLEISIHVESKPCTQNVSK